MGSMFNSEDAYARRTAVGGSERPARVMGSEGDGEDKIARVSEETWGDGHGGVYGRGGVGEELEELIDGDARCTLEVLQLGLLMTNTVPMWTYMVANRRCDVLQACGMEWNGCEAVFHFSAGLRVSLHLSRGMSHMFRRVPEPCRYSLW